MSRSSKVTPGSDHHCPHGMLWLLETEVSISTSKSNILGSFGVKSYRVPTSSGVYGMINQNMYFSGKENLLDLTVIVCPIDVLNSFVRFSEISPFVFKINFFKKESLMWSWSLK